MPIVSQKNEEKKRKELLYWMRQLNEDLWLSLHKGGMGKVIQDPGHAQREHLVLLYSVITVTEQWQQSQPNQEKATTAQTTQE